MNNINFEVTVSRKDTCPSIFSWSCEAGTPWRSVESQFLKQIYPSAIKQISYLDGDGDVVTIVDDRDYQEAVKECLSRNTDFNLLSVFLTVEMKTESLSASTSEASVATVTSAIGPEIFDVSSLKSEIIDSVVKELSSSMKKGKKSRKSTNKKEPVVCGACNGTLDIYSSPYFKCGYCDSFFLCEDCERQDLHGHAADRHVFIKFRKPIKKSFLRKRLLKQPVLRPGEQTIDRNSENDLIELTDSALHNECGKSQSLSSQVSVIDLPEEDDHERASAGTQTSYENAISSEKLIEEEDFLVVPLPACFDLNQPLSSEQTKAKSEHSKESSLEMAVRQDLENLACEMNASSEVINDESDALDNQASGLIDMTSLNETDQTYKTPPQSRHDESSLVGRAVNPASYIPSPTTPSIIQQVVSVNDSVPPALSSNPKTAMDILLEMGFGDRRLNARLLEKHGGNVEKVVSHLVMGGNDLLSFDIVS